jgi:hypothetical protein
MGAFQTKHLYPDAKIKMVHKLEQTEMEQALGHPQA